MWLPEVGAAATLSRMLRKAGLIFSIAWACGLAGGCAHHKQHHRSDDATLTLADLPTNVVKAFNRDHQTSTIKQIDKQTIDNVVRYKITYFDTDSTRHQVTYDRAGDTLDAPPAADDSSK